ncbi:MAG: RsmE family RNA methyltransferase [Planctomycetota bacterium]
MRFERFFLREGELRPGARVTLDPEESRHLASVLRKPVGAEVSLFDGSGVEARARLVSLDRRGAELEITAREDRNRRPPRDLELLVALPRGGAADDVLRRALECGASVVRPLLCARSVHRAERKKEERRGERFERLAIAVMKLSGRNDLPRLEEPVALGDVALAPRTTGFFGSTDEGRQARSRRSISRRRASVALVVGPEGGLEDGEIDHLPGRAVSATSKVRTDGAARRDGRRRRRGAPRQRLVAPCSSLLHGRTGGRRDAHLRSHRARSSPSAGRRPAPSPRGRGALSRTRSSRWARRRLPARSQLAQQDLSRRGTHRPRRARRRRRHPHRHHAHRLPASARRRDSTRVPARRRWTASLFAQGRRRRKGRRPASSRCGGCSR